jgi:hypothetical protein
VERKPEMTISDEQTPTIERKIKNCRNDRRKHERVIFCTLLPCSATLKTDGKLPGYHLESVTFEGAIADISTGGAQFIINSFDTYMLWLGEKLLLSIPTTLEEKPIELTGEIVNIIRLPNKKARVGIEFINIQSNADSRHMIERICQLTQDSDISE